MILIEVQYTTLSPLDEDKIMNILYSASHLLYQKHEFEINI